MEYPKRWDDRCFTLLEESNNSGVEYLLVGSMAKSHYHPQPHVNDMDLLINPTPANACRVDFVLRHFGGCRVHDPERLAELGKKVPLFHDYGRLPAADVITPMQGFSFHKAFDRAIEEFLPCTNIRVRVAAMCDLKRLDSMREQAEAE